MSRVLSSLAAAVAVALTVTGCEAASEKEAASGAPGTPASTVGQATPLTPGGAAEALSIEGEDQPLQYAASVVEVDYIPDTDAKLFGLAGGDPAINGLQTYLAVYLSPADGWAIYRLGDFNSYTVLSTGANRVDLEISQSSWSEGKDTPDTVVSKFILQWIPTDDGPPSSVTMTPAS